MLALLLALLSGPAPYARLVDSPPAPASVAAVVADPPFRGRVVPVSLRPAPPSASVARAPVVTVHFSPGGGCTAEVVARVAAARKTVRVLAYSFTSDSIAAALVAARRRGVDVRVVLDKTQPTARGTQLPALVAAGIPTQIDHRHAIMHDKLIVIDGAVVLTGSFNLTASAEAENAENLHTIIDPAIAAADGAEWDRHAAHSVPPPGPAAAPARLTVVPPPRPATVPVRSTVAPPPAPAPVYVLAPPPAVYAPPAAGWTCGPNGCYRVAPAYGGGFR